MTDGQCFLKLGVVELHSVKLELKEVCMKLLLYISLVLNLIIAGCEIWTLSKIRKKINIIKYYTFLQNFLALVVSFIFSVCLIAAVFRNGAIPEFVRGLRYIATCGLIAAMFIYVVFLSSKSENLMREEDFISNFNPKKANFILHYFCPILSLLSFVLFERQIMLTTSEWTGYAAIPSCLYWVIYAVLSATHLWKKPYDFTPTNTKERSALLEVLTMIIIPLSFILISYILWMIK